MKIDDFENSYDEATKYLKRINSVTNDSINYECYVYIYTMNGEFSFTIGNRKSIIGLNNTCIRVKNYIDDDMSSIDVIDIASVVAVRYTFICTMR